MMNYTSDYLFARPTFMRELGRLWDIAGVMTEFNSALTPVQADYFAMRADWAAVGNDLRFAMNILSSEVGGGLKSFG